MLAANTGIHASREAERKMMIALVVLVVGLVWATAEVIYRWRGGWRGLATVPLLVLVAVGTKIAVDIMRDPTSHNLWPLGMALWAAGMWVLLLVVVGLRWLLGRKERVPRP